MLTVRSKAMALGTTLLAGMTQFRQAHLAKMNKPHRSSTPCSAGPAGRHLHLHLSLPHFPSDLSAVPAFVCSSLYIVFLRIEIAIGIGRAQVLYATDCGTMLITCSPSLFAKLSFV